MIGLKRHTVKVVDHDADWAMLGAAACQAARGACGDLLVDVQHVGSTAGPDLPAKPILDLAAAVVTFDSMPEIGRRLTQIGYLYRGDYGDAGGHLTRGSRGEVADVEVVKTGCSGVRRRAPRPVKRQAKKARRSTACSNQEL